MTARVIVKSPTVWYSTVTIDSGRSDGIRVDQPVISGDGLVGKVTAVTGGTATVTLITDGSSTVLGPGRARRRQRHRQARPWATRTTCSSSTSSRNHPVKVGASVVTSGSVPGRLQSIFPRGIPIGQVTRVEPGELDLYQKVHIRPFADFRRLDFLTVLTGQAEGVARRAAGGIVP